MKRFSHLKGFSTVLFIVLVFCILFLELIAAKLSYENYSWVQPALMYFLMVLNIIPIALYIFDKKRIALVLLILLGTLIVPRQFITANKRMELQKESSCIINYIYHQKIENEAFPKSLEGYGFTNKKLEKHFRYVLLSKENFSLSYYVGTKSTSHFYRHDLGNCWFYYDD